MSRTKSPEKAGCWIVHDPANDAPITGGVTIDDPNWGGPHLRHNGRSNVSFVDGHVQGMKAAQWYWAGTPWLKPRWVVIDHVGRTTLPLTGGNYFFSSSANRLSRLFNGEFLEGFRKCRRYSMPSVMLRTDLGNCAPLALAWPPP